MNLLTNDFRASLLGSHEPPCLSLYQPTHRHHPGNHQDPIRFRNLVKELDQSLQRKYSREEIRPLLEPFEALSRDHDSWNHTTEAPETIGRATSHGCIRLSNRGALDLATKVLPGVHVTIR